MTMDISSTRLLGAVRQHLLERGMTRCMLADIVEETDAIVNAVLDGRAEMNAGRWKHWCDKLGLDYVTLVQGDEAPEEAAAEDEGEGDIVMPEGVFVYASQEELYRLFLFAEERLADNLNRGTRMQPADLYKLMQAMYALRDATLQVQIGEVVTPREK